MPLWGSKTKPEKAKESAKKNERATRVASLTGLSSDQAQKLLEKNDMDMNAALNEHFSAVDPEPPKGWVPSPDSFGEELTPPRAKLGEDGGALPIVEPSDEMKQEYKLDLAALSIKDLKIFIKEDCSWSLKGQIISEKADLIDYALTAAIATGKAPPQRPPPPIPEPPQPRLDCFDDDEELQPAAALKRYVQGKPYVAPVVNRKGLTPAISIKRKREEKALYDMVLLVLKEAERYEAIPLSSMMSESCIPVEEINIADSIENLAAAFTDCAEEAPWNNVREMLQKEAAEGVVSLRRDEDEEHAVGAVRSAEKWQRCKEAETNKIAETVGQDDMPGLTKQCRAQRELCSLTLDHVHKLSESRPKGIQSNAVMKRLDAVAVHKEKIIASVETELKNKHVMLEGLKKVIRDRNEALQKISEAEAETSAAQGVCMEESRVEELMRLNDKMHSLLTSRTAITNRAAEEAFRLKSLHEKHSRAMLNWQGVQVAAEETEKLLSGLKGVAETFVEKSLMFCSEHESNTKAFLAQGLLETGRLHLVMTHILRGKQVHLQATAESTAKVLQAEAPKSHAMESVLQALSSEKKLVHDRLTEIQNHVSDDLRMAEELGSDGTGCQTEILNKLRMLLSLIEGGPAQDTQIPEAFITCATQAQQVTPPLDPLPRVPAELAA